MGSTVILDLMGGIALLLWGLHMVHSGVVRAFGADLRRLLGIALQTRFRAFLAGVFVTGLLQSSTATGLMVASFVTAGTLDLAPALAVMLGANVGTTLVVQVLSFNIAIVTPILLFGGVIAFRRGSRTRTRDLGRVSIGIGLMLLALHIFLGALATTESAAVSRALLGAVTSYPVLCLIAAAAITWAAHSSVAVVLVVMSMGEAHLVPPAAVLALVLGANVGSALNPLIESGQPGNPASRRLPIGNLLTRIVGCLLALPFLNPITNALETWEPNPARLAADFHTAFNVLLALFFIGPLNLVAAALERWLPNQPKAADPGTPVYLDASAASTPAVALVCAAREVLRMGDLIETMLRRTMTALLANDRKLVAEICRMDNAVDSLNDAVKLYVTRMTRDSLDDRDGYRAMEIVSFSINLEHVGDIIDKNLMELASKKIRRGITFSKEGEADLVEFHQQVLESLRLAVGIFMSGDMNVARRLVAAKTLLREKEFAAAERYLVRLREGTPETIESYSLDLDILRDLKRVHSHLCSAAYPVLERAGALQRSRLRDTTLGGRKTRAGRAPTEPHSP
jgi:phosphate:Na+ symporter